MSPKYETLLVSVENKVCHVQINRPDKANSMSLEFWEDIGNVFEWIDKTPEVRVVVLSAIGKHFCAGLDLSMFGSTLASETDCEARKREALRLNILQLQDRLSLIERCRKPVLAAVQGGCIGGGIDMISACDMRYSGGDVYFTIKEIDIGMTADVGTLQRLPYIIGDGIMRELAYTGRNVYGEEAQAIGMVNKHFETKESMMEEVMRIASDIAAKSPISIRGTKEMIIYTRSHTVEDGLNYIATWNAAMLQSNDLMETMTAKAEGRDPVFSD
jgi:enoyl-CoA hydratase